LLNSYGFLNVPSSRGPPSFDSIALQLQERGIHALRPGTGGAEVIEGTLPA
jgi:hypothetical protein